MPERFELLVTEVQPARFAARLNGELLVSSRTPLFSAARELVRRGVRENAILAMRHEGQDYVAMTTTVGAAARLTVIENGRRGPWFGPYSVPGMAGGRPPAAVRGSGVVESRPLQTAVRG